MPPREAIGRRTALIRMLLSEAPRRHEREEDFTIRIAIEIERLANRMVDDCRQMRGGSPSPWLETPEPAHSDFPEALPGALR